ncbi:MAG: PLP-dependent cysteine synthase family protein [Coriobacteriales bacterium]|jgi:cysteine synthase A
MIYDNVLDAMGHTPLIRLNRMQPADAAQILVKYEGVNVGGSVKTRVAAMMLDEAEKRGDIGPDSIIVEPTSGNQGIGLALVAAVRGWKARIIMPDSVSEERRKLVHHYGAEVVIVHDEGDIGKAIDECIKIAKKMEAEDPRVYVPQQFENIDNVRAHRNHTALEIAQDAGCHIHGFCSGIGTGGTITGVGQTLKRLYPDIEIWAVEPENAAILSGGGIGSHLQMGIGDGIIPKILDQDIYDNICVISDEEAIETSRDLARLEGLMCGISSGTNVAAAKRLAQQLGPGKTVATILPDTGERYYSTPLFEGE